MSHVRKHVPLRRLPVGSRACRRRRRDRHHRRLGLWRGGVAYTAQTRQLRHRRATAASATHPAPAPCPCAVACSTRRGPTAAGGRRTAASCRAAPDTTAAAPTCRVLRAAAREGSHPAAGHKAGSHTAFPAQQRGERGATATGPRRRSHRRDRRHVHNRRVQLLRARLRRLHSAPVRVALSLTFAGSRQLSAISMRAARTTARCRAGAARQLSRASRALRTWSMTCRSLMSSPRKMM